jgi:membrane-associated phospholipid phosphatase
MPGTQPAWARTHPRTNALLLDIGERMRARFWLKALGITAFMGLFFAAYFHLLRHPGQDVIAMPLTAIDRWIGFHPWAFWPYVSLWLYVVLPPGLLMTTRELVRYGTWIAGLCLTGLACFYVWPTAVPNLSVQAADYPGFGLLRGVDAAGNACPSLHVATATFSVLWLDHLLREVGARRWARWLNVLWFGLIVWSTLAIKQHVWLDVVAGAALALLFAPASLPRRRQPLHE